MMNDARFNSYLSLSLMTLLIVVTTLFVWSFKPTPQKADPPVREKVIVVREVDASARGDRNRVVVDSEKLSNLDPEAVVLFAQKVACRQNAAIINQAIEYWYLQNGEQYPKNDLSDIARDKNFFPRGVPMCPITGARYRLDPMLHRVLGHSHGDVPDITIDQAMMKHRVSKDMQLLPDEFLRDKKP